MNANTQQSATYARQIIATMNRETRSRKARLSLARLAIKLGNYDAAGKAVFADYLKREETA